MTPREELIALDRDALEQQVIHLEQKLESAQFERNQERARAEKAEAACAEREVAIRRILPFAIAYTSHPQRNPNDSLYDSVDFCNNALSTDAGKGWLSPEKRKLAVEVLESAWACIWDGNLSGKGVTTEYTQAVSKEIKSALAALKESQ